MNINNILKIFALVSFIMLAIVGCQQEDEVDAVEELGTSEPKPEVVEEVVKEEQVFNFPEFPYIPSEGAWLFIGQDLDAVGGLENYNKGYIDYIGEPAGVTTYTGIGDLGGLYTLDNWGAGDVCAQYYIEDESFDDVMIAIGLSMVGDLEAINNGSLDENIESMGNWITEADRPVFLRIGYEFDGEWNAYDSEMYKEAYQKIVTDLRGQGVTNFVSVWQSTELGSADYYMNWWPGDEYVDWLAYSYFNSPLEEIGIGMLEIAREKDLPVYIAELTPRRNMNLGKPGDHWKEWFIPFFTHVKDNDDVIKAVSYISQRWDEQPMWKGQGWGDSRPYVDPLLFNMWTGAINDDFWIMNEKASKKKEYVKSESELAEIDAINNIEYGQIIEAESGTILGSSSIYGDDVASGGAGIAYIQYPGDGFSVVADQDTDIVCIRYASENTGTMGVVLDGERTAFKFKGSGSWVGSYKIIKLEIDVKAGQTVAIEFAEDDFAMNVDFIKFGDIKLPDEKVVINNYYGVLEAEAGKPLGGAMTYEDKEAASGGLGMSHIVTPGDGVTLIADRYTNQLSVRYASNATGVIGLYVNNQRVYDIPIVSTLGWSGSYDYAKVNMTINEGDELMIRMDEGDVPANIDFVDLGGVYEAEAAIQTGTTRLYSDEEASGGEGIAYIVNEGDGFYIENVKQASSITVRYATINSGFITLYVNDQALEPLYVESTGDWVGKYNEVTYEIDIEEGSTVALRLEPGQIALNVDYLALH